MASRSHSAATALARQARELFIARLHGALDPLVQALRQQLLEQMNEAQSSRDLQARRDAWVELDRQAAAWIAATAQAWRQALEPRVDAAAAPRTLKLELIADDVMENRILASRLALAVQEQAVWELGELRLRITHLEGGDELGRDDVLRPDAFAQQMVDQWVASGLSRSTWTAVRDAIQLQMVGCALEGYRQANGWLVQQGVLPAIDLHARVRRAGPVTPPGAAGGAGGSGAPSGPGSGAGGAFAGAATAAPGAGAGAEVAAPAAESCGEGAAAGEAVRQGAGASPFTRARARAQGLVGQLRRLVGERPDGGVPVATAGAPSPALSEALAVHAREFASAPRGDAGGAVAVGVAQVQLVAQDLLRRSAELKQKAGTSSEKATIEVVALIFQSILAEERIPPSVRVWFARLQMPVLRVALAEPEFFGSLEHPARRLIDRMGSCVLGFDAAAISGSALEEEVRRVVQVIEQYPETGQRVFQLLDEEFQQFLGRFLTDSAPARKAVSVAQQVEQKETMAIQYTIELRRMLADIPVRDAIREFLFQVWAEVLAMAAMRHGAQHAQTLVLKKCAGELVWATSAKPTRQERALVIRDLPALLARLREGMTLLGLDTQVQEVHIKAIGDTLADAFLSKTEAIPQGRLDEIAERLAHLEDFLDEDDPGELPLDEATLELMLGRDAQQIAVLAAGRGEAEPALRAWARELQIGQWFTLEHQGAPLQVQYAWHSERRQLHLLAARDGRGWLVQLRGLALLLQSRRLLPSEEEALTVRATREALARLDAEPGRLLG